MDSRAKGRLPNSAFSLRPRVKSTSLAFDVNRFLNSTGVARRIMEFRKSETIYSQGNPNRGVKYIQKGGVRLSVINEAGKEAVVAILGAGQSVCMETATAIVPTSILFIEKAEMIRLLREEHGLCDRFIVHVLARNIRVEEGLLDQLFNSSEKRLARTLLLLARYGKQDEPQRVVAKIPQELLAEMIGTTRSRVNFFMNKFRKLGFIEYSKRDIQINKSLLNFVLHD
jgi:CRP/FNR family cyclic AMP-dependent transcriptional regulator